MINDQYSYQRTGHAVPRNSRRGTNRRTSGRSRGRRSNDSASPRVYIPFKKNLLEMLQIERIINAIEETLKPILEFTDFPKGFLENVLLPSIPSEEAAILTAGVLLYAAKKKGTDEIGKLWRDSTLRWSDLFGTHSTIVENFIKKNKLEFTVNPRKSAIHELLGPDRTTEEMEHMSRLVIDEFLNKKNIEDTIRCVVELASPSTVYVFIYTAINEVLKRWNSRRNHSVLAAMQARSLGQLLVTLQKRNLVTFEQYKTSFAIVLDSIDGYAMDTPLFWNSMGKILEPMIEESELPLVFLKELLQPCIPSEAAGLLVSAVLHCSEKRKGTVIIRELWRKSGLKWTDFLGADSNVEEFIQKQKLEFLAVPTKVEAQMESPNFVASPRTVEEVKQALFKFFGMSALNETIYFYIDARLQSFRWTKSTFIRALVLAVHEKAISGANCALNKTVLNNRIPLLKRYIDHNAHFELEALYVLQSLMERLGHPNGLLQQIFHVLYDGGVIKKESFKTWELSVDPNESAGKAAAVRSVNIFLNGLFQAESGKESERGLSEQPRKRDIPPPVNNENRCCVS